MPAIQFSFSGSMTSNIETLKNLETFEEVDVSGKSSGDVVAMLNSGQYSFSFGDAQDNAHNRSIEMDNFEAT
jgi:hypothetical protein